MLLLVFWTTVDPAKWGSLRDQILMDFFTTIATTASNDLDPQGLNKWQTYVFIPKQTKFLMEYSWQANCSGGGQEANDIASVNGKQQEQL